MAMFGLELRKVGSTETLYREVDRVLGNTKMENMQRLTVAHALQKMMQSDHWFSVCTIQSCINVCQVIIPQERLNIYQAAHCIRWSEMLPEYRQSLVAMVLDDFRSILNA